MGYDDPKWILQPELIPHRIDPQALPLLCRSEDYQLLELLLGLEKQAILALTLHRFAPRFESRAALDQLQENHAELLQDRYLIPDGDSPFSPTWQNIQVCPLCLDEPDGYDRLYWRVEALLSCPRHHVLLISSCPDCYAPIPALRPDLTICPSCKRGDYRSTITPLPTGEAWLFTSQDILLHHLGIDAEEMGERALDREPSLLYAVSPRDYFSLTAGLEGLLNYQPTGNHLRPFLLRTFSLEGILAQTVHPTLVLLHYLLADWPAHFWGMLERCRRALWEDSFRFPHARRYSERWDTELARSDYWGEEAYREEPAKLLRSFSSALDEYFRFYRDRLWHREHAFGETILPEGHPQFRQLACPTKEKAMVPLPWEDLTSVICRTARAMNYGHPSWVLVSVEPPRRKVYTPDIPLLHRRDDYRVLEGQIGLDEEGLYRLSLHRFVGLLQPRKKTQEEGAVPDDIPRQTLDRYLAREMFLPFDQTKVCPACLDESIGYDRLFWRLQSVVACPRHQLLLVDRCPACHASIPPLRLHLTLCPSCRRGDYRRAPHLQIPSASWLWRGQELLFGFIDAEGDQSYRPSPFFVESPLVRVHPWQYFELLTCFHVLFLLLSPRSVLSHAFHLLTCSMEVLEVNSAALQVMSTHLTFFHFVFARWPEHFLSLIDAFTSTMRNLRIGGELFESLWDAQAVFEHLWLSRQQAGDVYGRLIRLFQNWIIWGAIAEVPGEPPFPATYHRGCSQLLGDYKKRFGVEPTPYPRTKW